MRQVLLTVFALLSLSVAAGVPAPVVAQDDGLAPEGVTVTIDIEGDGDARWTIGASYVLNESSDHEAFQDVAREFERGQGSLGFSIETFERVVPQVAEQTGRNMAIESPEWTSAVENESGTRRGHLWMSFTWTNFSRVDNETVTLDGVFAGGWFGDLDRGQSLVITPPPGFDVSSAQPSHETVNGTLRWSGPVEFGAGEPVAAFERQPIGPDIPWMSIAGAVLTALVIGGIIAYAWFWRTREDAGSESGKPAEASERTTPGESANGGTAADTGAAGSAGEERSPEATTGTGVDTTEGADEDESPSPETTGEAEAAAGETESETETELLSDEERVERLLAEHGGRMKQAKIVEETRWSNAKVSQLLSQMADADRVEKLRIGRENLISLPEDEEADGKNA